MTASFNRFRAGAQQADYDVTVASVKASLVRGYTFDATHATVADVTGAGGVLNGTTAALANPSVSATGVFDADDTSLTASASVANHGLLLYQSSAVTGGADVPANQQLLIGWIDTGTGLPIQPGAGSVAIAWNSGSARIYAIT